MRKTLTQQSSGSESKNRQVSDEILKQNFATDGEVALFLSWSGKFLIVLKWTQNEKNAIYHTLRSYESSISRATGAKFVAEQQVVVNCYKFVLR